jgi:exopolyphosphatase / guanosine-5'-triphosphate,3'-diphosphate pyrophosphatase
VSARLAPVEALLDLFDWDVEHCRQVRDLALMLFDQLAALHKLGPSERDILEAAALLHDIGWTIAGKKHHKHSYRLIRENEAKLIGFTPVQVELIANVARYHRKAPPSPHHEAFASLTPDDQHIVQRLAAVLRIADGLDRPHLQQVKQLACEVTSRQVSIGAKAIANAGAHIEGAARKRELFETVFDRSVEFSIL